MDFTIDLELINLPLFDNLGKKYEVPLEISCLALDSIRDGFELYGTRAWSTIVAKRLEDDRHTVLRAPGFPDLGR